VATGLRRRGALLTAAVALSLGLPVVTPGTAGAAVRWRLHLVQVRETAVPGPAGQGVPGPRTIAARFSMPTRAGDLLVAAVIDGVDTSGMPQPRDLLPGWTVGQDVIGGNLAPGGGWATGGLQAAIYFYPDNPGGIRSVTATSVARGVQSDVTVLLAEFSGAPRRLSVDGTGGSTSGPTSKTDSTTSTVSTDGATRHAPDLVLATFNNGGNAPHGETFSWSRGWALIGEDTAQGNIDQPVLFDYEVQPRSGVAREQMRYAGGYPIDNCAAMVALT
jgi:hypothetical protein